MPSSAEIQQYFSGAWQLMLGRPEGLHRLDLTTDGFWNSFYAMIVSVPALAVGWVSLANRLGGPDLGDRVAMLLWLGTIDFLAWTVPLALLAAVARPAGFAHRFIPYVVASNWGSALLIWVMVPLSVVELVFPGASDLANALSLVAFVAVMVLAWRLTNASLGLGAGVASAVFGGTFVVSLVLILTLQPGLAPQ